MVVTFIVGAFIFTRIIGARKLKKVQLEMIELRKEFDKHGIWMS